MTPSRWRTRLADELPDVDVIHIDVKGRGAPCTQRG